jgi:hypothetical protein
MPKISWRKSFASHTKLLCSSQVFSAGWLGDLGGTPGPPVDNFERQKTMDIRKIGAAAGFAAGAAFAFAPLASADTPDFTSVLASEAGSLNSLFLLDTSLTGVTSDQYGLVDGFYAINPGDVADVQGDGTTPFDYLLYGLNPTGAGLADDPGSYNVLNGALTEFYDAYNVSLYPLLGGTGDIPATDLIGSADNITAGLAADNPALYFFNFGVSDLAGYFGIGPAEAASASADPAATFDIGPTLSSEIASLNSMFESYAPLSAVDPTDIIKVAGGFDTIATADTNDAFNALVFGLNPDNVSPDIGSYDVLNGALGQFDNAYNVGLFSLLDPTGTFDPTDIIGTHAAFLDDGAFAAIGQFLSLGVSDLLGYFDPSGLLAGM